MMTWLDEAIPDLTDSDRKLLTDHIDEIRDRVDLIVLGGIGAGQAFVSVCKDILVKEATSNENTS